MKKILTQWTALAFAALPLIAADKVVDPVMGIYDGFWAAGGKMGRATAQIRPIGGGKYDGFITFDRAKALEGALKLTSTETSPLKFKAVAAPLSTGSLVPELEGAFELTDGRLTGNFKGDLGEGHLDAKLAVHESPTMGAKVPAAGKVLFDGKSTNGWTDFRWKLGADGSMVVSGGDIHAKEKFVNYNLHLEFKTPFMPDHQGQARGNSGVYLQDRYEVQVLDSFGLFPLQNNDCGAIYSVKAPDGNACFPPGQWQTYDITFVQGKGHPAVTVVQNGVTVIDKYEIPSPVVDKGTGGEIKDIGFLRLQDHGNPVEYRNIWVEPFFATDRK